MKSKPDISPFYFELNVFFAKLALNRLNHILVAFVLLFLEFFFEYFDGPFLKALLMNIFDGASAIARDYQWEGLLETDSALFMELLLLISMAVKRHIDWKNYRDYCGHFLKLYNRNEFQFHKIHNRND